MSKIKLSKKLLEILELMNSGWEFCQDDDCGIDKHWRLQKGKLGHGGDCIYPHGRTRIHTLIDLKLIKNDGEHHFPTTPYYLTSKGKLLLKE